MKLLKNQYSLVQGSRGVALDFIEKQVGGDWTKPPGGFNGSNIRYLLVHTANTYRYWLGNFALRRGLALTDDAEVSSMAQARALYYEADALVDEFLNHTEEKQAVLITNERRGQSLSLSPLQLFTHVTTHEFHHKGQIMSMCRQLGHAPPDTDIIRF